MKESLTDLNSLLFEQLERLGNPDLSKEELAAEIVRARAVSDISGRVIENANIVLQAAKFQDARLDIDHKLPKLLGGQND
jgi:hypothetical protein